MESDSVDTVVVYTTRITARVKYIFHALFADVLLTESMEASPAKGRVYINYSDKPAEGYFSIVPSGLLTEETIHEQSLDITHWEGLPIFFQTPGDLPFDIFSASFYLLSRYEEYLPYEPDLYDRYPHTNSMAYKEGFLKQPLINQWLQKLQQVLCTRLQWSSLRLYPFAFRFIPTYDVDEAFSYLHKPVWKNVLGFYRDLLQGKFEQVMERGNVYSGRKKDPYDTFDWIEAQHRQLGIEPVYFFLTILKRGRYDKNLPASSRHLQDLYRRLSLKHAAGLHPSWRSGAEKELLEKELQVLQKIVQKLVCVSRNHYLRFRLPDTYRRLLAAGISEEYSMAYGSVNGFRASYCQPFYWYDLEKETVSTLRVHPFCFMDATSFFNQGYGAAEAAEELQYYHDTVKGLGGEFITVFHNHFLTEQPQWIAWREMYRDFLEKNFG